MLFSCPLEEYWKASNIQQSRVPTQVRITLLRRHGLRLRADELSEPMNGVLQLRDWPEGGSFGRAVRVMELLETVGTIQRPATSCLAFDRPSPLAPLCRHCLKEDAFLRCPTAHRTRLRRVELAQ